MTTCYRLIPCCFFPGFADLLDSDIVACFAFAFASPLFTTSLAALACGVGKLCSLTVTDGASTDKGLLFGNGTCGTSKQN